MAPYRVAIIGRTGKGDYGHGLDTVWEEVPETQVVAVADEHPEGLAKAQARTKAPKAYADYREMLDNEQPKIVAIGPRWIDKHHEMILACVERGCHIYMEKPFCRTPQEADEIIAAVERKHIKLAIAHQTHYSPLLPVIKDFIASGQFGELLEMRARGKEDHRGGAEDLFVLGSHLMDLMRVFAGDPLSCYAHIESKGAPATKADVIPGNEGLGPLLGDNVHALYQFSKGVTGSFSSRRNMGGGKAGGRFGLQLYGSKGVLEILTGYLPSAQFLPDPSWSPGRTGATWVKVTSSGVGKPESLKDTGLHGGNVAAVKDLLQAIEKDTTPQCSVYEGRWTVEMILAAFASHRAGGPVALPLANREHPLNNW